MFSAGHRLCQSRRCLSASPSDQGIFQCLQSIHLEKFVRLRVDLVDAETWLCTSASIFPVIADLSERSFLQQSLEPFHQHSLQRPFAHFNLIEIVTRFEALHRARKRSFQSYRIHLLCFAKPASTSRLPLSDMPVMSTYKTNWIWSSPSPNSSFRNWKNP